MSSLHTSILNTDEKQLKDDFEVLQYLRINKLKEQNTENYSKFLNQILSSNKQKEQRLQHLNKQIQHQKQYSIKGQIQDDNKIELLNMRFHQETQIKGDLKREVEECKKSIRLLRGDIGHIVKRNQSEKLLSSKINKVQIIALDQYQKVSNQMIKQKQQMRQLRVMRQIFMQKLHNSSKIQRNGLVKTQQSYLQLLHKHKGVQLKLNQIEKNDNMIQQYSEMRRKTQTKKFTVVYVIQFIRELQTLTSSNEAQFLVNSEFMCPPDILKSKIDIILSKSDQIIKKLQFINPQDYFCLQQFDLQLYIDQILQTYSDLQSKLLSKSQLYKEGLKKLEELRSKILSMDSQQQNIGSCCLNLNEDTIQEHMMLQNTIYYIKCLFKFLNFYGSSMDGIKQLIPQVMSYMSASKLERLQTNLFEDWENKINQVIDDAKNFNFREKVSSLHKFPKRYSSKLKLNKGLERTINRRTLTKEARDEQNDYLKNQALSRSIHQSFSKSRSIDNGVQRCKAKRIKFLQRIDQDYYKMLKETLKMQKQYTRSNYQFMRRFKRDKYVKRDNISNQKQFQSTFSVLWSSKQANLSVSQMKTKSVKSLHRCDEDVVFKKLPLDKSLKLKSNSTLNFI